MNNAQAQEKQTIGHSILQPSLLDAVDELTTEAFSSPKFKKLFEAASRQWEEERVEPLNELLLAERTKIPVSEITELTVGIYKTTPDNFRLLVRELRGKSLSGRLWGLLKPELEQNLKTGAWEWAPEKVAEARAIMDELEGLKNHNGNGSLPTTILLSDVKAQAVPWLWRNYIPRGRGTLFSGDPGSAKTWFLLSLASRLSRGLPWPDGSPGSGPASTYYMSVEDDARDTIRPRVDSLGGDPSRIAIYNSETPLHIDLSTEAGRQRIEREIVNVGNVQLVVIDPIADFSGDVNPNAAEDVRALLTPLIQMAARRDFALVIIGHLNKAQTMSAIYRAGGSTSGWLGKCRASFMIFRDINERGLRHVIPIKANLAPQDPPQLEFRIDNGRLEVRVSDYEVDPDEHIGNQHHGPDPREREDALVWLEELFMGKYEIPATDVEEAARMNGISGSTLKRAKKQAGFKSHKRTEIGGRAQWVWSRGPS